MYMIGSDAIAIVDEKAQPEGIWHAVDDRGVALCTGSRARYVFPALSTAALEAADGPTCLGCVDTLTAPDPPSAREEPQPERLALVPALDDATVEAELAAVEAELGDALADEPVRGDDEAAGAETVYPAEPVAPAARPEAIPAQGHYDEDPWGSLFA